MNTWLKAVVEQSRKVGLSESNANNRTRWILGINTISGKMRRIRTSLLFGDETGFRKTARLLLRKIQRCDTKLIHEIKKIIYFILYYIIIIILYYTFPK